MLILYLLTFHWTKPLIFELTVCIKMMRIPNIPKDVFIIFLPWPPKNHSFIFNNKFYKQIDGVAMGPPLGPALINIFMCSFENNGSIIALIVWSLSSIYGKLMMYSSLHQEEKFKKCLSSKHPNINFLLDKKIMVVYLF